MYTAILKSYANYLKYLQPLFSMVFSLIISDLTINFVLPIPIDANLKEEHVHVTKEKFGIKISQNASNT